MQSAERTLLLICSGVCALIVLDTNIVAVSLPSVARALHAGFADLEWIVSAYMLAFASLLLPVGSLADRFGRRRMMLLGLGIFSLASLACGLSVSILMLQLARAAKGVGAAMLLTSALAVIGHVFHTEAARTRAWAVWGACMGVSVTVAPLLGGLITQWLGWRWIFLLNLPVCLVLALLALRHVGESNDADAARLDPLGALLFSGGLGCLIWALIHASAEGWHGATTAWSLAAGLCMLFLFVPVELCQQRPMIDLRLFRQAPFTGAVLAMFGYAAAAQVMMTVLPLYIQTAFGSSAVVAGLAMLPFAVMMMLFPKVAAALALRWPLHVVMALGMALVAAGNLLVALAAHTGLYWLVLSGMLITGMASGISTTTRFTAIVLAVAVLGCILSLRTSSYLRQGFAAAQLPLPSDIGNVVSRVVAGDRAAALAALGQQLPALQIVQAGFAQAFSCLMMVAALLAAVCGVLLYLLMGRATAQSKVSQEVAIEGR